MHSLVARQLPDIERLCREHGVRSLALFGSAASSVNFDPDQSDIDIIVDFLDPDLGPWMRRFFAFRDALQSLLGRPIDLILASSPRKPYFSEGSKVPLYAAA